MADNKLLPSFLKELNNMEELEKLRSMVGTLERAGEDQLNKHIKAIELGMEGEEQIAKVLKKSSMPMYVLHDVYLEHDDLSSQIDFLVFTSKICFVIECKNMNADVEIDGEGTFYRIDKNYGRQQKTVIYSPYAQDQRHLSMVKLLDRYRKKTIWRDITGNESIDCCYMSVVVFSNSGTTINADSAKPEMKDKIIHIDQLIDWIKEKCQESHILPRSDKEMRKWAEYFLGLNSEIRKCHTQKYDQYKIVTQEKEGGKKQEEQRMQEELKAWKKQEEQRMQEELRAWKKQEEQRMQEELRAWKKQEEQRMQEALKEWKKQEEQRKQEELKEWKKQEEQKLKDLQEEQVKCLEDKIMDAKETKQEIINMLVLQELVYKLKDYRLQMSRAEGIKPYTIYNNFQLMDIIIKMPKNIEELTQAGGFDKVKAEKYGDSVLSILDTYRKDRKKIKEGLVRQFWFYK